MIDLILGPLPVLAAERIERQTVDPQRFDRAVQLAHRFHAAPMAESARQAAPLRPAAIAVHDDGDALWNFPLLQDHDEEAIVPRNELALFFLLHLG